MDMRVLELAIECGPSYPEQPPDLRFRTRVNLPFVKSDGRVDLKTLGVKQAWRRNNSIEDALNAVYHGATTGKGLLRDSVPVIRKYMEAAEGSIHFNAIALAAA